MRWPSPSPAFRLVLGLDSHNIDCGALAVRAAANNLDEMLTDACPSSSPLAWMLQMSLLGPMDAPHPRQVLAELQSATMRRLRQQSTVC